MNDIKMIEPIYEADPNCKQCKGTGSVLFDSEAGREYDDCECLKQIDCEKNLLFKAKTMHAAMSANIAKGDPKSDNIKGLTEVAGIIFHLITTIEQKHQLNAGLCKTILKQEATIESQKEEIERLRFGITTAIGIWQTMDSEDDAGNVMDKVIETFYVARGYFLSKEGDN